MDSTGAIDEVPTPEVAEHTELTEVQLDGLVILKIIQHAKASSTLAAGSLLGLEQDQNLEVTNCYAFPSQDDDGAAEEAAEYQLDMMKMLREVNVDNNCVGWYQSTYLSSYCNLLLVETQYNYQANLGSNTVVIVYDAVQTSKGKLWIKAFRLTAKFMKQYAACGGNMTQESLKYSEILEEVPIRIHNSGLINAFLFEQRQAETSTCDFDRLDLCTNPFLEKNLEFLCEWVDDLAMEMSRFQNYERQSQRQKAEQQRWIQKRKEENKLRRDGGEAPLPEEDATNPIFKPIPQPSRLEALLISHQIDNYCKQINTHASQSFTKLFLAGSLHKDN